MISTVLSLIIRLAVLLGFAFLFIVLYEHGPENYLFNAQKEFSQLMDYVGKATSPTGEKTPDSGT
jgi:hypothetical protein